MSINAEGSRSELKVVLAFISRSLKVTEWCNGTVMDLSMLITGQVIQRVTNIRGVFRETQRDFENGPTCDAWVLR